MAAPAEDVNAHPFGDDVPDNPVTPTYFDPCAGYSPRDKTFKRRPSDGKWIRTDQIADEQRQKEKDMTPQTTAIAERQPIAMTQWPKQQIDLVRRTVAVGATDDELALYLYDCDRRGIHPLDKLLHFTKRGGKYTPVTSIDFMRAQAAMSGEMAGSDDPVFTQNPVREGIDAATVTVYRLTNGQRFAYTATARWSEYCPDNAPMWRRMPHTMLGKCAEALALRKAFPQQLAGLYSSEEMDQSCGQALPVVTSPARSEAREKPVAATVESRGSSIASQIADAAQRMHAGTLSDDGPDLGTADLELPEGFRLIDDYKLDGDWHHVTWGRDAQGGHSVYKTKLASISLQAHNAFTERMPVKLHSKKYPYLDKVEKLGSTVAQIKGSAFKHDDDRFCDECHRPVKDCIC